MFTSFCVTYHPRYCRMAEHSGRSDLSVHIMSPKAVTQQLSEFGASAKNSRLHYTLQARGLATEALNGDFIIPSCIA
jgi:hypothetical protein